MRAAQYLRVPTDLQRYSIANQKASIEEYAQSRGFEIVRTYADEGKSGLDLIHRPALTQLLRDIITGEADFEAVLVLDISRWGRFQDADESGHYEFLCKKAGIPVHYCAELFNNDDTLASNLIKTIKRVMAGEYVRELSAKVLSAQCRIASSGCKLGGQAGYGLRRLLTDRDGNVKGILKFGDRKTLVSDKVRYVLGPESEIRIVNEIFNRCVQGDSAAKIARDLNARRIPREPPFPSWGRTTIHGILHNPKYMGCLIFNRTTQKLRSVARQNPRDKWIVRPNSFPAVIPPELYEQAQEACRSRTTYKTREQLLEDLRTLLREKGKLSAHLILATRGMSGPATYRKHFGNLLPAYSLVGYKGSRNYGQESFRRSQEARRQAILSLINNFERKGVPVCAYRQGALFKVHGHTKTLQIEIARYFIQSGGKRRWDLRPPRDKTDHYLVLKPKPWNSTSYQYCLFKEKPDKTDRFRLKAKQLKRLTSERGNACGVVDELCRFYRLGGEGR